MAARTFPPEADAAQILDRIADGFFALDRDWRVVYANRRSIEILSRDLAKADVPSRLWDRYPGLETSEFGRAYRRAVDTGEPQHIEAFYEPHGRWYEVHAYPSPEGLSVYFRDVTERRRIEADLLERQQRLELVLRATQDLIWEVDVATRQLWVSGTIETVFGFGAGEVGTTVDWWMSRIHKGDRQRIIDSFEAALAGTAESWSADYRFVDGYDEVIWVFDRAVIVHDESGRATRAVGATMDVTDRKNAEEWLRASREQARRLARQLMTIQEEERGSIARDVHDVLGQALTAMKIDAVSLARSSALGDEERARAGRIADLADRAIKDVRQMATRLRPTVLDDLGLVPALRAEAKALFERTGIVCEVIDRTSHLDLDREVSTAVFRIVQEALTNVARHSAARRSRIEIYERHGQIAIDIVDDGRGIAEHVLSTTTSRGLPGMHERMLLVGGEFTVRRGEDGGTVVALRIPDRDASGERRS